MTNTPEFQRNVTLVAEPDVIESQLQAVAATNRTHGFVTVVIRPGPDEELVDGKMTIECIAAKLPTDTGNNDEAAILELSSADAATLGFKKSASIDPSSLSFDDVPKKT